MGSILPASPKDTTGDGETTADLITAEGYPVETHEVVTEDGYILTIHRYGFSLYQAQQQDIFLQKFSKTPQV